MYFYQQYLQHLPDFKGIEILLQLASPFVLHLQHLPDFKGIEIVPRIWKSLSLILQHLPDFKGIEINSLSATISALACSTSLTSKGLKRVYP